MQSELAGHPGAHGLPTTRRGLGADRMQADCFLKVVLSPRVLLCSPSPRKRRCQLEVTPWKLANSSRLPYADTVFHHTVVVAVRGDGGAPMAVDDTPIGRTLGCFCGPEEFARFEVFLAAPRADNVGVAAIDGNETRVAV
jgi:hypothetical protein